MKAKTKKKVAKQKPEYKYKLRVGKRTVGFYVTDTGMYRAAVKYAGEAGLSGFILAADGSWQFSPTILSGAYGNLTDPKLIALETFTHPDTEKVVELRKVIFEKDVLLTAQKKKMQRLESEVYFKEKEIERLKRDLQFVVDSRLPGKDDYIKRIKGLEQGIEDARRSLLGLPESEKVQAIHGILTDALIGV